MRFKEFYINEDRKYPTDQELYEKYKDNDVYFSYRSIDKLGINPKSRFDTPNGIYAYPVRYQTTNVRFTGDTNTGFVYFFKLKPGTNLLDLGEYNKTAFDNDIKKLKDAGYNTDLDFSDSKVDSFPGNLWFATYKNRGNANKWNYLLRKVLGYDAVLDRGEGIIHNNEPAQIVVLNPTSIEVLETGMYDKRTATQRFDVAGMKKENQLKYVDAFVNNLKNNEELNGYLLIQILHQLHPDNYKQFIENQVDNIHLMDLSLFADAEVTGLGDEMTKNVLVWLGPVVEHLLHNNIKNVRYFPEKYQIELIKHYEKSFKEYSSIYAIPYIINLDDRLEYLQLSNVKPWVVNELKSDPKVIFNSFKTTNLNIDKMIKVLEIFEPEITKFDTKKRQIIFKYFNSYIEESPRLMKKVSSLLGLE